MARHTNHWTAPGPGPKEGRAPVRFSADEEMVGAIERATALSVGNLRLRVVAASDLIALKFWADEDPSSC